MLLLIELGAVGEKVFLVGFLLDAVGASEGSSVCIGASDDGLEGEFVKGALVGEKDEGTFGASEYGTSSRNLPTMVRCAMMSSLFLKASTEI